MDKDIRCIKKFPYRLLFKYYISKLGDLGVLVLVCADNADTEGVKNIGKHADIILNQFYP